MGDIMKIRKATKKDISAMVSIIKLNSPNYPVAHAKKEMNEMFGAALQKPTYIVAEKEKKVVGFGGFISSWIDNMIYDMFWISIHPDYKGISIGTKIINEIIASVKKERKPLPKMIVISTKIPKYYKKFGFKKLSNKYDGDYILMGLEIKTERPKPLSGKTRSMLGLWK